MKHIFTSKKMMPLLALTCALLWALAYPLIKLGYREIGIPSNDLGSKVLFAGLRFLIAGVVVLLLSDKQKLRNRITINAWGWLLLFAVVNTSLHYLFSYIGLGYIQGSRGTIIDSMGSFFLILLSCMIYTDDKFSVNKALGCFLGISGIVFMNAGPKSQLLDNITFLGDGMILFNSLCAAFGGIIGRTVSKKMNMTVATGMSMAFGGLVLCILGIMVKPTKAWSISSTGIVILTALVFISAVSFTIYNQLLANHPISKVAIFNALIPVFGVIFSCLILQEPFNYKYLVAGVMVTIGIVFANKSNIAEPDKIR